MLHLAARILQRLRQLLRAGTIVLQQMEGHACGRFLPHAGQEFETFNQ